MVNLKTQWVNVSPNSVIMIVYQYVYGGCSVFTVEFDYEFGQWILP